MGGRAMKIMSVRMSNVCILTKQNTVTVCQYINTRQKRKQLFWLQQRLLGMVAFHLKYWMKYFSILKYWKTNQSLQNRLPIARFLATQHCESLSYRRTVARLQLAVNRPNIIILTYGNSIIAVTNDQAFIQTPWVWGNTAGIGGM